MPLNNNIRIRVQNYEKAFIANCFTYLSQYQKSTQISYYEIVNWQVFVRRVIKLMKLHQNRSHSTGVETKTLTLLILLSENCTSIKYFPQIFKHHHNTTVQTYSDLLVLLHSIQYHLYDLSAQPHTLVTAVLCVGQVVQSSAASHLYTLIVFMALQCCYDKLKGHNICDVRADTGITYTEK